MTGGESTPPGRPTRRFGSARTPNAALLLIASLMAGACSASIPDGSVSVPGREGATKSTAFVRAERRAYDGAPPVIPHEDFRIECNACHDADGMDVPDVGYAPPLPHDLTIGLSEQSRCRQCHVFSVTGEDFVANTFVGLRQDLRRGGRLHANAPPTMPHGAFMRENCAACHTGPAAREPIRTSHPERERCRQCHLPVVTTETFPPLPPTGEMQ